MFNFLYGIFGWLFRILYSFINNYGLALVLFTVFFRLVVLPTNIKTQKSSAKSVRMQSKLKRIKERYADYPQQERQQKIQEETNALYQREGYSAMTQGCAPLLIQLPILWGLYGVVRQPLTYVLDISKPLVSFLTAQAQSLGFVGGRSTAYAETAIITNFDKFSADLAYKLPNHAEEIEKIKNFDFTIFGVELGSIPDYHTFTKWASSSSEAKILLLIPILAFITSMMTSVLTQMRQKKNNPNMDNRMQGGCMMLMMPLMSLWFTFQFPAGMGMYWIFSNIFAFFQTLILGHIYAPRKIIAQMMIDETINARAYEKQRKLIRSKQTED